jgi:hypothetical protein
MYAPLEQNNDCQNLVWSRIIVVQIWPGSEIQLSQPASAQNYNCQDLVWERITIDKPWSGEELQSLSEL